MTVKVKRMAIGLLLSVQLLLVVITFLKYKHQKESLKDIPFSKERQLNAEQFIKQLQKQLPVPGISLAMVNGDSVFCTAAGIKNENQEPLTSTTPIFTGSISEPLLATAILKLSEEGKIDIDAPVVKYLSYFKMGGSNYKNVTVRHLLTHTSGINKYEMIWDLPNFKPNAPEVTTRSIASQVPKFPTPGTRVSRSPTITIFLQT